MFKRRYRPRKGLLPFRYPYFYQYHFLYYDIAEVVACRRGLGFSYRYCKMALKRIGASCRSAKQFQKN
ncbi:hypothetical protein KHA80_14600 [Anaerobacillus sp. HL2]|nr:hypothetical protein KHA80_14600 [Anaerobacillus sp. HL2]